MFGRGTSIQLARILGIRIGVDISWFIVLFIFIFLLSGTFRDVLDSTDGVAYLTAVLAALIFFVSLVAHELGHAVAARREGINTQGIDLWFFGGIARLDRDSRTPGEEFRVAIAGPIVTLGVVAICTVIGGLAFGFQKYWDAALFRVDDITPALLLVSWLATINVVLFVFNMIPAFPLDGGRIARSVAWIVTKDRTKATRFAATLGQLFAYLLIGYGIFRVLTGDLGGLWSAVLGYFLLQAARGAVAQTVFTDRIDGITIADIMDTEPVTIPGTTSVADAEEQYFLRYRWPWFPVVDEHGRYLGLIREERVTGAMTAGDQAGTVAGLLDPGEGDTHIAQDAPLEVVLGSEPLRRLGALFAVDHNGILRGVVTLEQVRRALQRATVPTSS